MSSPGKPRRHGLERRQRGGIAIALAKPDQPAVGLDLDDRAQRIGFVNSRSVEQRRIAEGDRGDADCGDLGMPEPLPGSIPE